MELKELPTAEELAEMGFKPVGDKPKAAPGLYARAKDDAQLFYREHPTDSGEYFLHVRRWVRRTRGPWASRPAV